MSKSVPGKNVIVTTTINAPTQALKIFSELKDWNLIVVGDKKTPHEQFADINCLYLSPEEQMDKFAELSETIGWNSIQRRNLGFVEAYNQGAEIIATVDDDNIPYPGWGENLIVNREVYCDTFDCESEVFDPLSVTDHNYLWHRGYPLELVTKKNQVKYVGRKKRRVLVQADLWDGDPDIDALARLTLRPIIKFSSVPEYYCGTKISPFNSQNTFLSREVLRDYCVIPFIGRMDDIWASYILQLSYPDCVAYSPPSVYQDRNQQDLVTNLEKEIVGYRNTYKLILDLANWQRFLPVESLRFLDAYQSAFN